MLLAVLLFPWTTATAISPKNEGYALTQDPPSVAIVDLRSLKVVTAIPVGLPPKHALAGPDGGFLYVLSHKPPSKKGPETDQSEISIIDLGSRKLIKTHPITGKVTQFVLTEDKRHLFCFVPGSHEEGKPNVPASILFFDTHTNEVAGLFSTGGPAEQVMYRGDLKRIFALSAAVSTKASEPRSELRAPAKLTVFQLGESKPVVNIELPDRPTVMGLSSDEKWLYVVDRGYHNHWSIPHLPLSARTVGRWVRKDNEKNHRDGWVRIYDVALLNEVAVHKLGTSPWKLFVDPMTNTVSILGFAEDGIRGKLYEFRDKDMVRSIDTGECPQNVIRVAELPGRLIVSYTDIRFVPDDEKGQPFRLPLNASKLVDRPAVSARFLDGWPGEVIYAPQLRRMIIGAISAGAFPPDRRGVFYSARPEREIAFLDVSERKLDHVTKIGRTGVKFGKAVGQVALAAGMGMATGIASYSMMSPFYVAVAPLGRPITFEGNRLVVGPDGDHVYALHIPTNDVTIMKTATGAELDKVAVGGGAYGIFLAPGGKFVYTCTPEDISLIDTKTNKVHLKHHVSEGKIIAMQVDDANDRIYALTTQSIVVLDAREGKLLGKRRRGFAAPVAGAAQMRKESQS